MTDPKTRAFELIDELEEAIGWNAGDTPHGLARALRLAITQIPTTHIWVPIAECGELQDRHYVQNDAEEGMCVFKDGKPTGTWRGVRITHVLSPHLGPIPKEMT